MDVSQGRVRDMCAGLENDIPGATAMNQIERPEQFDIEAIRKKISQVATKSEPSPENAKPLNEYADNIARQFAVESRKPFMVALALRASEALLTALGCLAIGAVAVPEPGLLTGTHVALAFVAGLFAILLIQLGDGYQIPILRSPRRGAQRAIVGWLVSALLYTVVAGHAGASILHSGMLILAAYVGGAVVLGGERFGLSLMIRRWSRNGVMERRAVIIGGGNPARELIRELEGQPDNDIRICGIFDDRDERRSPDMVAGYPKLGTFEELVEFARKARIDMMIISLPLTAEARILELLKMLWVLPVDIRIAAHSTKLRFRPRSYSHIGQVSMLDVFDRPINDWDSVAKRCFDLFFAVFALLLVWPIMLAAAIAVKVTSKGPVIFVQKRHGFNNEVINVYKFRSMYTEMSDPTARNAVTKNDPRVTPVGRFIRKTSIDELPQLFNVLEGTLSLVGPRPHAVLAQTNNRKYADVVDNYFARHRVKPGVTGWAQINGWRGEVDHDDKIKGRTACDLYYIENWSLWLDLKILFLTPLRLMNTENAY